jgi:hypothetical protein
MNIIRLLIELFIIYVLYKLVVDLIIPVYKTTRIMKQKMAEAQKNMESSSPKEPGSTGVKQEDYIDFEEVK